MDIGIGTILGMILIGLVAGALARLLVPGRDKMGILATILLGIVGSFVGGFLGAALLGNDGRGAGEGLFQTSGIIGSIIGAIIALLVYNALTGRKRRTRTHV